jgi:hypothetical protein
LLKSKSSGAAALRKISERIQVYSDASPVYKKLVKHWLQVVFNTKSHFLKSYFRKNNYPLQFLMAGVKCNPFPNGAFVTIPIFLLLVYSP